MTNPVFESPSVVPVDPNFVQLVDESLQRLRDFIAPARKAKISRLVQEELFNKGWVPLGAYELVREENARLSLKAQGGSATEPLRARITELEAKVQKARVERDRESRRRDEVSFKNEGQQRRIDLYDGLALKVRKLFPGIDLRCENGREMLMKMLSRASQDADSARKEIQSVKDSCDKTLKAWDDQVRVHVKELVEERAKVKALTEENARLKHPEHELLPGDLSTPENYTQEREQPESLPKLVEYLNSLWRKYDSRQKDQRGAYSKGYWRGRADGTAWIAGCVASLIRQDLDQAASGPKGSAVDFVARHALHQLSCEFHKQGRADLAAVIREALDKPST